MGVIMRGTWRRSELGSSIGLLPGIPHRGKGAGAADRDHALDGAARATRDVGWNGDVVLVALQRREHLGQVATSMYAQEARSLAAKNVLVGFSRRSRWRCRPRWQR